jgi:hypothetical protein
MTDTVTITQRDEYTRAVTRRIAELEKHSKEAKRLGIALECEADSLRVLLKAMEADRKGFGQ